MLDTPQNAEGPRFAFDRYDEVIVRGVSYRPQARRPWGYVFGRTDATGVSEQFDNGKLAHLVKKGLLTHNRGAFLPASARERELQSSTIMSGVTGRVGEAMKFRSAFVEAFSEFELAGKVKRIDASISAATPKLQRRAAELLGSQKQESGHTGKHMLLPKAPCPSTLRRWVSDFEDQGFEGLCDAKSRSGNRLRQIGLEELSLMGPIIDGYADPLKPSQIAIFNRIGHVFAEENRLRKIEGRPLLEMPSRETVRREIKRLDPYSTYVVREG